MDKAQFYHQFWSRFTWPAYDESTVPGRNDDPNGTGSPDGTALPYITYMVIEDEFEHPIYPSASLWTYGTSWATISQKVKEIYDYIGYGGRVESIDGGRVWVQRGHPFAQRVSDDNDMIRRIIINVDIEFMTG